MLSCVFAIKMLKGDRKYDNKIKIIWLHPKETKIYGGILEKKKHYSHLWDLGKVILFL